MISKMGRKFRSSVTLDRFSAGTLRHTYRRHSRSATLGRTHRAVVRCDLAGVAVVVVVVVVVVGSRIGWAVGIAFARTNALEGCGRGDRASADHVSINAEVLLQGAVELNRKRCSGIWCAPR